VARIAEYGERDVERLLADAGIVRHRGKIEAAIANAAATRALHERHETLDALLWTFAPHPDAASPAKSGHDLPVSTPESNGMARELKRRGFRFIGPTTAYSLMEAGGLVNDHLDGCEFRAQPSNGRTAPDRRPPAGAGTLERLSIWLRGGRRHDGLELRRTVAL
jgi:DNA-3-methyladenine glycosylase I